MADTPLAQIQVQELLKEVRVDYSRSRIVESAVAAVTETLLSLSDKQVFSNPPHSQRNSSADAFLPIVIFHNFLSNFVSCVA